jgi:eukaryotic-like serine/threonine-protein kinase
LVLDEAFQEHLTAEQIVVTEELEEEISSPSRAKNLRRPRPIPAPQPLTGRTGPASARSVTRPAEPVLAVASGPVPSEDSDPVVIEIEDGGEAQPAPREVARKAPVPTRPADDRRTEPRRVIMGAPLGQRSVVWLVVSFLLLVVAGAAAVLAIPQLEHLLKPGQEMDKPPPPRPIRPTTPPSGPPGTTPGATSAEPPAPTEAPAAAHVESAPAPTGAGDNPPAAVVAAAPSPGTSAAGSNAAEAGDDLLVPLPTAPQAPPKKATPSRPPRKTPARSANKEVAELQRDWAQTRGFFIKLTTDQSCESTKIGILCKKYEDLKATLAELGPDSYDKEVHARVKKLRNELAAMLRSNP